LLTAYSFYEWKEIVFSCMKVIEVCELYLISGNITPHLYIEVNE